MSPRAAIVGEESARIVSENPNTEEAKNAEAMGYGFACGIDLGSLNLVQYKDVHYLIGTSHGFYKNGELKCKEPYGLFFPFDHYRPNNDFDEKRSFKFLFPPLNHNHALRYKTDILSTEKLRDFVILKIEEEQIPTKPSGEPTKHIKLENFNFNEIKSIANENKLTIISGRKNYHNYRYVGIEIGCRVYPVAPHIEIRKDPIFRHDCDTGKGSSGAFLHFLDNGQIIAVGMHYGNVNVDGRIDPQEFSKNRSILGNYFISTQVIIDYIESHILNANSQ